MALLQLDTALLQIVTATSMIFYLANNKIRKVIFIFRFLQKISVLTQYILLFFTRTTTAVDPANSSLISSSTNNKLIRIVEARFRVPVHIIFMAKYHHFQGPVMSMK